MSDDEFRAKVLSELSWIVTILVMIFLVVSWK